MKLDSHFRNIMWQIIINNMQANILNKTNLNIKLNKKVLRKGAKGLENMRKRKSVSLVQ